MKTILSLIALLTTLCADAAFYQYSRFTTNYDGVIFDASFRQITATFGATINSYSNTAPLVVDMYSGTNGLAAFVNVQSGETLVIDQHGRISGTNITTSTLNSNRFDAATLALFGAGSAYAGPTVTFTNFISGRLYTNATARAQTVCSSCFVVCAAVSGAANMLIQEDVTGNTTIATVASCVSGTTVLTPATTYIFQIQADIVPGGVYAFTNTSTGSGNATSLQSGTGFIRSY